MGKSKIHFIAICGTAMAPIAVEMKRLGFDVCGSDKGFFPPVSTYLEENNIDIELGYKREHIDKSLDFVVLGNAVPASNIEYKEALKLGLKIYSYPEILKKYLIKEESIVVAGEYGKTTITSLLAYIFYNAHKDPSYMFGGVSRDMKESVKITDSKYSIVEGDEYNASGVDKNSKFLYYEPKYLILTSLLWDHIDLFPEEKMYIEAFEKLIKKIPKNGVAILNKDDKSLDKIKDSLDCKYLFYSINDKSADFHISSVEYNLKNINFTVNNKYKFQTSLIGDHNISNLLAGISLSLYLGLDYESIKESILKFRGPKRRLEIRYESSSLIVIDDFAHSAYKIKATVSSVRSYYKDKKILAVFEPRSMSAKDKKTISWYKNIFKGMDKVIITDIHSLYKTKNKELSDSEDIVNIVKKDVDECTYVKNYNLVDYLLKEKDKFDVIIFMSTGSFQGGLNKFISLL